MNEKKKKMDKDCGYYSNGKSWHGTYCLPGIAVSATSTIRFNAPNFSEVMPLM